MVTYNTPTNNYATSRIIVSSTPGLGNYTTIQAAINAATSDSVIFILPGTYTENLTLKSGANLQAFAGTGTFGDPNVIIVGKMIDNGVAVNCSFESIQFVTNGDFIVSLTAASSLQFINCNFRCTNAYGIRMNSVSSNIYLYGCTSAITSTGISLWNVSIGDLWIYGLQAANEGGTTTNSIQTGGAVHMDDVDIGLSIAASGGNIYINYCEITTSANNVPGLALSGTAVALVLYSKFISGTASCITVGAGSSLTYDYLRLTSDNANQIG